MTTSNFTTENLTKAQLEIFNSLVKLGDSKELALKTVLEMKPTNASTYSTYYNAHHN